MNDLSGNENINWPEIRKSLKENPTNYETLLFKIHVRRKRRIPPLLRQNILSFLQNAYDITKDVRYYNEFLWCYIFSETNIALKEKSDELFLKNLSPQHCHFNPFDRSKLKSLSEEPTPVKHATSLRGVKICLIGLPIFFGTLNKILEEHGAQVQQIFIPRHPSKVISLVLKIKPLVKFASLVYKNPFFYKSLNYDVDSSLIFDQLMSQNYTIGFHKLNFIIRRNIFTAFQLGLINDHWAPLPYMRGKSTLAYSLLFGFPIIVSTHFIEDGVDTGKIIKHYEYQFEGLKKINQIKSIIRKDLTNRVVDSIRLVTSPGFKSIENDVKKGLTFYEIHPKLYRHIEDKILNSN